MSAVTLAVALEHLVTAAVARHEFESTLGVSVHPTIDQRRQMDRSAAHKRYREAMVLYWSTVSMEDAELLDIATAYAMDGELNALRHNIGHLASLGLLNVTSSLRDGLDQ